MPGHALASWAFPSCHRLSFVFYFPASGFSELKKIIGFEIFGFKAYYIGADFKGVSSTSCFNPYYTRKNGQ